MNAYTGLIYELDKATITDKLKAQKNRDVLGIG